MNNEISVIILVGGKYNKEIYEESLKSISWVDEIIKVDGNITGSNFADLRNQGAKKAKNKWLFYLDQDEIVTASLKKIILESTASDKYSAYAIPRRNFIFGKELKHCGLWPDYVIHLIKKESLLGWQGELHEQPQLKGELFHLSEPLLHKKHDNLSDMVDKTNNWSEIEGRLMFEAGHPPMNLFRFASAAVREFWLRMIRQTAFLDGTYGIIYALYQVYSRLISYSKLWELQLSESNKGKESNEGKK